MADISPDQHVKLEKWCVRNKRTVTPLIRAQIDVLKELDAKCQRCRKFPIADMKCEGMRMVFNPDESGSRLVLSTCHKRDALLATHEWEGRVKKTKLPSTYVKERLAIGSPEIKSDVQMREGQMFINGSAVPILTKAELSKNSYDKLKDYMIALVENGWSGLYVLTLNHYSAGLHLSRYQTDFLNVDWLIVSALDFGGPPTHIREEFISTVHTRVHMDKPTTVVLHNTTMLHKSEFEKTFFEEIAQWKPFPL